MQKFYKIALIEIWDVVIVVQGIYVHLTIEKQVKFHLILLEVVSKVTTSIVVSLFWTFLRTNYSRWDCLQAWFDNRGEILMGVIVICLETVDSMIQ